MPAALASSTGSNRVGHPRDPAAHAAPQTGLDELLVPDLGDLMSTLSAQTGPRFRRLNAAMAGLLDDYSMIGFSALDVSDEDSIGEVLMQVRGPNRLSSPPN